MVTIREIAKACSVSIATVSNVLNHKGGVSDETRATVLAKVEELHYVPNSVAKNLKTKKTHMIGIVVEDITVFSVPGVVDGITACCEDHGYGVSLVNLRLYQKWGDDYYYKTNYYAQVKAVLDHLAADQVEAIIYLSAEERELQCLPEHFPIPLVMSYAYSGTPGIPSVLMNEQDAAQQLVEYALSQGHRRIGVITGKQLSPHTQQRLNGYRKALENHGLPYDETLICEGDWSRESGQQHTATLIDRGVTAIFCMNDVMAGGAYDCLNRLGLRVGQDFSVFGYDDRVQSEYFDPPLTTVRLPLHNVGYRAAALALEILRGVPRDQVEQETFLPCQLVLRDSVAPIPHHS